MSSNNLKSNSVKVSSYVAAGLALFFVDQITKYLVYSKGQGWFLNKLRPVFGRQIFPNYNFAFSLPVPLGWTYVIYVLLLGGLVIWFARIKNKTWLINLGVIFILAGAASNIWDRATLGYVRDFVYVFWGNIFNLADIFIVAGILMLLV